MPWTVNSPDIVVVFLGVEKNLGSLLTPVTLLTSKVFTSPSIHICLLVLNGPRLRTMTSVMVLLNLILTPWRFFKSHLFEVSILTLLLIRTRHPLPKVWRDSKYRSFGVFKSPNSDLLLEHEDRLPSSFHWWIFIWFGFMLSS